MPSVSFEQEMTINPDWGLKNLEEALRDPSDADWITPEVRARVDSIKPYVFTVEIVAEIKKRHKG